MLGFHYSAWLPIASSLNDFCSHWPVHMDLLNIEMVGGNGQLLLVFHPLLDTNMQL